MMAETVTNLVSEAKRNRFSQIHRLSHEDVLRVFDIISEYIQQQLSSGKGVNVIGVGTFTLAQTTLDLGNRQITVQRPVFLLSEKLAMTHALQHTKHFVSSKVPVLPINYTALANESPFDRDTIELCIKEVLLALNKYISQQRHVEFVFPGIGKLLIRDSKAKMKFYREFVSNVDGSGEVKRMPTAALHSRLSVMSSESRPPTATTITLPRLVSVTPLRSTRPTQQPSSPPEGDSVASTTLPALQEGDQTISPPSPVEGELAVSTATEPVETDSSQLPPARTIASAPAAHTSTCSHAVNGGQNLCYVCHQREIRNMPISMKKYRQEQEHLEAKMLEEYMKQSKALSIVLELKKRSEMKKYNEEVAAYNLTIAQQALKDKRNREKNKEQAFVFERNIRTPEPKFQRRAEYRSQLDEQVAYKKGKEKYEQDLQDKREKLENQLVAEELAADDEAFQQQRIANMQHYRQALAEQVENKPEQLPVAEPDSLQPIFGVHDKTDGAWDQEQKRKAKLTSVDQMKMVAEKEEAEKRQNQQAIQEGINMLARARKDLIADLRQRRQEHDRVNEILKNSWNISIKHRHAQEKEQAQWEDKQGITVLEQLEAYPRCAQCKRKPENTGTTNLVTGTRYAAGCKLMN
ncbi:coiled-coil domain-containing protein 81-like [Dysidea avara]|uniref:coiled-coil domain-containing protein 81-like n=1 Tax=Dysidea avara TaxID=196820 RepID=UPI00333475AE